MYLKVGVNMLILLNEIRNNNGIIGYTYFDLDKYIVGKFKKPDLRQRIIWGEKEQDKLYAFKNLPILELSVDKNKPQSYKIIVIGRIEIDKGKYLYLVSYGTSVLRIQNEKCFFEMKKRYNFKNVNIDESFQFVRSNKESLVDLNVLKIRKRVQEGKLSVVLDSKEELNNFFKVLEQGYRKEIDEDLKRKEDIKAKKPKLSLSDKTKVSQQFYKENKEFIKGCLDGELAKNELISNGFDFIESKKMMSDVQYNLDMTLDDIKRQVDNLAIVFCKDNDCKLIMNLLKSRFENVMQLSKIDLDDMMEENKVLMNRYSKDKFKNEPCVYCVPMKNLSATFIIYEDKNTGGFVSLSYPNATYIPVNGVPDYNLDFLIASMHEYVHYLSSSNNMVGFIYDNFPDKRIEMVLRAITEGITDILAGYFVYCICKEKYAKGETLKDSLGKDILLEDIEKSISPYLNNLMSLKSIDSINECEINKCITPIYTGHIGYKYNDLFLFYFFYQVGLKEVLDLFFSNDYLGFLSLAEEKLGDTWFKIRDELQKNTSKSSKLEKDETEKLIGLLGG